MSLWNRALYARSTDNSFRERMFSIDSKRSQWWNRSTKTFLEDVTQTLQYSFVPDDHNRRIVMLSVLLFSSCLLSVGASIQDRPICRPLRIRWECIKFISNDIFSGKRKNITESKRLVINKATIFRLTFRWSVVFRSLLLHSCIFGSTYIQVLRRIAQEEERVEQYLHETTRPALLTLLDKHSHCSSTTRNSRRSDPFDRSGWISR